MLDLDDKAVSLMNEYILSGLNGSSENDKRIFRTSYPSGHIIIGSIANVIVKGGVSTQPSYENSISLKIKTKKPIQIPGSVKYSVYVEGPATDEEKQKYEINKIISGLYSEHTFIVNSELVEQPYDTSCIGLNTIETPGMSKTLLDTIIETFNLKK